MCRSTMTAEEWAALQERIKARRPTVCRACGAPDPVPTFLAPREWECVDWQCAAVFTVEEQR